MHLGGQSIEADWETVLRANIVGRYNLFEAARRRGVKRVVFASTNHVMGFYPAHHPDRPPRAAAADIALRRQQGVRRGDGSLLRRQVRDRRAVHRIGNFADQPLDSRRLSIWISPRDFRQLVRIGLEHPEIHFEIVYGASESERSW